MMTFTTFFRDSESKAKKLMGADSGVKAVESCPQFFSRQGTCMPLETSAVSQKSLFVFAEFSAARIDGSEEAHGISAARI